MESELCGILWDLIECREDEKYTKDDQEASSVSAPSIPEGTRSGFAQSCSDLLCLEQAGGVGGPICVLRFLFSNRKPIFLPKTWNLGWYWAGPLDQGIQQTSASVSCSSELSLCTEDSEGSLKNDRLVK